MHALVGISLCYKQIKPKEKTKLNIKNPKSKTIIISIVVVVLLNAFLIQSKQHFT